MFLRASLRTIACACVMGAFCLQFSNSTSAQGIGSQQGRQSFGALSGFDLNPLQSMTQLSRINEIVPMEGAVDPERYVVGPGDVFSISVGGPQPIITSLPVSADGHLLLPSAGAVDIAGRRLTEARRLARAALQQEFQNVRVEVTLAQPRQFYVHISGAVPTPGRYVATPVARVSTVLNMAFLDTTRVPVTNPDLRPSLRNIKLVHQDGTSERIDLLKYYATGETDHNPYLNDGDVISIPTYNPDYGAVFISGDVPFPGTYDHRPDDTLYDLLVLATGEDPPTGFREARVYRIAEDGRRSSEFYDLSGLDARVKISARDQVHAVRDPTLRGSAAIEGWVEYPGTYPIRPGETTLDALLDMAGGLRPGALDRAAYLHRATLPPPELRTERRNRFELTASDTELFRADSLTALHYTRLSGADFLSRAYLAHELRLQNRVPVDLSALDGTTPIRLEDGDRVFVPRDEQNVFVFGQVNRPGYVPYEPGSSLDRYVAASGGFGQNAGAAYVIEAGTGRYLSAQGADIQSGDRIFVDRAVMQADTEVLQRLLTERRRMELDQRARTVTSIVQAVSAATAIITTYLLVRREF